MRGLPLISAAVLIAAGFALVAGVTAAPRSTGAVDTRTASERFRGSGVTGSRLTDFPTAPPATEHPNAFREVWIGVVSATAPDLPTCMGHPVSPGGLGTAGNDHFRGSLGRDVIIAGPGKDVVYGRGGEDIICGGPGEDQLVGGRSPAETDDGNKSGGDRLAGGPGDDLLEDRFGDGDRLFGGPGEDRIVSRGSLRVVRGGPGADTFTTGGGYDELLRGGRGNDVIESLSGAGISRSYGGGPGRDTLDLGGGGDIGVYLNGDGDRLTIHGEGYYLLSFWDSPLPVEVNLTAGTIRHIGARSSSSGDTISYVGRLHPYFAVSGSRFDDRITSSDRRTEVWQSIDGGEGNDTLIGLGEVDYIRGEEGDDTIYGGDNRDGLEGGPGNDYLDAGPGDDDEADGGRGVDSCLNAERVTRCAP